MPVLSSEFIFADELSALIERFVSVESHVAQMAMESWFRHNKRLALQNMSTGAWLHRYVALLEQAGNVVSWGKGRLPNEAFQRFDSLSREVKSGKQVELQGEEESCKLLSSVSSGKGKGSPPRAKATKTREE